MSKTAVKTSATELTPSSHELPLNLFGSGRCQISPVHNASVHAACAEIVARWRRAGLSEQAALEQAERFAGRFLQAPHAESREQDDGALDALLEVIGSEMAAS